MWPAVVMAGLLAVAGCVEDRPTGPDVEALEAKGGGGSNSPQVNEADPNSAPQDTTLDVRVLGAGFDQNSGVRFLLNGKATNKVVTNSTRFVSDTEVVANITIALDADVALYDIEVSATRGRPGVGTELFGVTQKEGGGDPRTTSLSVDMDPGTVAGDGSGAYVDGEVTAVLQETGTLSFVVSSNSGRALFIDEIRDGSGNVLVPLTGLTGAGFFSKGCCDLRAMTADSAGIALTRTGEGETLPVKLELEWSVGTSSFSLTMGANNGCIDPGPGGNPPDDDPGRGAWARVSRTIAGADTTWTVEDGGLAAVCEFIDEKGRKNDRHVLHLGAVADLRMILSSSLP